MTTRCLNRRQVREIDRRAVEEFGVPGVVLMENAGRGAAEIVAKLCKSVSCDRVIDVAWSTDATPAVRRPVVICCGRGNNAGDGFVIARHLDNRGIEVRLLLASDPDRLTSDAAVNFEICRRSGLPMLRLDFELVEEAAKPMLQNATCIVDALLGTGAEGPPRAPLDRLIVLMNQSGRPIVAIDVPSGLDCDSGATPGAVVRATATCTFVAPKPGLEVDQARQYVGELHVIDIGAPRKLVQQAFESEQRTSACP